MNVDTMCPECGEKVGLYVDTNDETVMKDSVTPILLEFFDCRACGKSFVVRCTLNIERFRLV